MERLRANAYGAHAAVSPETADEIRELFAERRFTISALAERFGCSRSTVYNVLLRPDYATRPTRSATHPASGYRGRGYAAPTRPAPNATAPAAIRGILMRRPGEAFVAWRFRVDDELTALADQLGGRALHEATYAAD